MNPSQQNFQQELPRLHAAKRRDIAQAAKLGPEMIHFFKQSIEKRQGKLAKIAECWGAIVPDTLNAHCSLESLSKGSLTVLVDSASHLYELKQLLLAGIQQQLLLACKSTGLRKINLRPGRWYESTNDDRKLRFD